MCVFCDKYAEGKEVVMENETCFAIRDTYPVGFGHMLVLPKDCKETYFDLTYKELEDMNILIKNCKTYIDARLKPDGYNIGFNCGKWAGQSIDHAHAHIIPRYAGDVPATELKGGIRNFKKPLRELDY
jgi:diadenosine tetraphosphate (Ap4A) HIT family hydrolase